VSERLTSNSPSNPPSGQPPVGRVVATELKPSTPHQFYFWTARESPVGIGAIVRVDADSRTVFGVVTDGFAYSDLQTPMHAVIGADGDPAGMEEPTRRAEIRLFAAAVLRHLPEEPVQPVPLGLVHLASDADVVTALRMDAYTEGETPTGIPVGSTPAGGLEAPVYVDADFLLGPEAAHLNISGVSGSPPRPSAVEFLLTSIFQRFPPSEGPHRGGLLQREGAGSLLPRSAGRSSARRTSGSTRGLASPRSPLRRCTTTLPTRRTASTSTRSGPTRRSRPIPSRCCGDFARCSTTRRCLLNRDDVDAKADAFIDFLAERVVGREYEDNTLGRKFHVKSFADLDEFFRAIFRRAGGGRAGAARSGAPITSPPSGRSATASATSAPAPRAWSPTTAM
jgi:hypothetical protein